MSLHKLTAGSGYDYLTRQVAALDATAKGHVGLASYYTEKGETPGVWVGSGMAGIDGLDAGDVVTAEHMQNLFGAGHHPLATDRVHALDERIGRVEGARPTEAEYRDAARLGAPFKVYENDVSAFRIEVAKRLAAANAAAGLPSDWAVPAQERARIRTDVARQFFSAQHGRAPSPGSDGARELAATIAQHSRPKTTAVAGYDLTFSPVKSVSTLWAIADPATAAAIERAHHAAVQDALTFLETTALYSREGANGVRQVDVRGLVATAFTHRDSRAGDPDLHTHVVVANKVQTLTAPPEGVGHVPDGDAGKWLAIDGRPLHKAVVATSETYNTALEHHLTDALGLAFAERPDGTAGRDLGKRAVREIVGVDPRLNTRFSKRRLSVEDRRAVLVTQFQDTHGRPPTPVETIHLAQQATLETREAKHEPRSLAKQRDAWHREAIEVLGTPEHLARMVHTALHPTSRSSRRDRAVADSTWFAATADRILSTLECGRSTWQYWHVYAEAQRQTRTANVATPDVPRVVNLLVSEVLDSASVRLARPSRTSLADADGIAEPDQLRRADGTSVYTSAGSDLYTSQRILAAEQRLVAAAGRRDGHAADATSVDLALLESTANGLTLNAGQATMVRAMATSGARLQLAIAPAGSGKTTAMRALARAWTDAGGTVIGLAPSAAAADALRTSMAAADSRADGAHRAHAGIRTDTLAKLTHTVAHVHHHDCGSSDGAPGRTTAPPDWVADIGPATLVVIDEAGMADTLSLDAAVSYVLDRGGSVRLIGDDQQLTAIGAGGVLRDIRTQHGALQLTELVRFTDPGEGAASLALRDGRTEALGFYLDLGRVHVGDLATISDKVFAAWVDDHTQGRDAIMLAPTRELVSDLNRRARAHRIDQQPLDVKAVHSRTAQLGDGNDASVGDSIITRENNRRLRLTATDWVKNGDRWTVLAVHQNGALTVQHTRHHHTVRLPHDYVHTSTGLGYACTVHTAQGVTADTMHGLATGQESRQQLYTMMTRGSVANHIYLQVVGDGDPHSVVRPELTHPRTPTEILESILARDDTQRSATSLLRDQADPATRLGHAAQRYLDSLHIAAEDVLRRQPTSTPVTSTAASRVGAPVTVVDALDATAQALVPGLSSEAAWPTLRSHLLLLGADGNDPSALLTRAVAAGQLTSATDRAAVLDWRLDAITNGHPGLQASHASTTGTRAVSCRPLPWLPAIPELLAEDPQWGEYLTHRAELVESLAAEVRTRAVAQPTPPVWAQNGLSASLEASAAVEVWRAAMQVPIDDRRPTGPPQSQAATRAHQRHIGRAVTSASSPVLDEWRHLLYSVAPQTRDDGFTPMLAERLAAMSRAGLPAHHLLRSAATTGGALPDHHAAAALWWRMARHVTPAVAVRPGDGKHHSSRDLVTAEWTVQLHDLLGGERAGRIQDSAWWPALVTTIDHALQRGWRLEQILGTTSLPSRRDDGTAAVSAPTNHVDECQELVWRTSIALTPVPTPDDHEPPFDPPPADLWDGVEIDPSTFVELPERHHLPASSHTPALADAPRDISTNADLEAGGSLAAHDYVEPDLAVAALIRDLGPTPLEPTDAELRLMGQHAEQWYFAPVSRERMVEINQMTRDFFEAEFTDSWSRHHLADRIGIDLAGHEDIHPGHAPAGWHHLVNHLRHHGVTDEEMFAVGVATMSSRGHLIDKFRDRLIFPISHHDEVLGFVGRRHPDLTNKRQGGPKYLNTTDTPLFHKGAQLFGANDHLIAAGAMPVIVEGPVDAIAVTVASAGRYLGLSPLGTSLTEEQTRQLAEIRQSTGHDPIVAPDADLAGQLAAERDFWILAPHGLDPRYARLPSGLDPAELLTRRGPAALTAALAIARPLGDHLLSERLTSLPPEQVRDAALRVAATRPPHTWPVTVATIRARLALRDTEVRSGLRNAVKTWDRDPRKAALTELNNLSDVRGRLRADAAKTPAERWTPIALAADPRLIAQPDWPATAAVLQRIHEEGCDVETTVRIAVGDNPLGALPARDLRYRLAAFGDIGTRHDDKTSAQTPDAAPPHELRAPTRSSGRASPPRS